MGAMAEGRRVIVDGRLEALETQLGDLQGQVHGVKRQLDRVTKGCSLVVEGATALDALYLQKVGGEVKLWRELKAEAPEVLCKELTAHLGLEWPPTADTEKGALVLTFYTHLRTEGTVQNVFEQQKWNDTQGARVRIPGTFVFQLQFSIEMLELKRVLKGLERELRRSSGLKVGPDEAMAPVEGAAPRRLLVYTEKTPTERAQAKGKGKGGKGKGKGKAKGGVDGAAAADGVGDGGVAVQVIGKAGNDKGNGKGKGKGKGKKGRAAGR